MGNKAADPALEKLLAKFNYVCEVRSVDFDQGSLYRKRTLNYDYIVLLQNMLPAEKAKELQGQLRCLQANQKALPLLRLHYFALTSHSSSSNPTAASEAQEEKSGWPNFCTQQNPANLRLTTCLDYANYALSDHIAFKRKSRQPASLNEYVFAAKTAAKLAVVLSEHGFKHLRLDIEPECLFVTAKGELKLLPLRPKEFLSLKQDCACFSEVCDETINRKAERTPGRFKAGQDDKAKYLRQIKGIAQFMFEAAQTPSSSSSSFISKQERSQIYRVHSHVMAAQSIVEVVSILAQFDEVFFVIGTNQLQDAPLNYPLFQTGSSFEPNGPQHNPISPVQTGNTALPKRGANSQKVKLGHYCKQQQVLRTEPSECYDEKTLSLASRSSKSHYNGVKISKIPKALDPLH